MKVLVQTLRHLAAGIAILTVGAPMATWAATQYLDLNGATTGFWNGSPNPINTDIGVTNSTWSTSANGTTTPGLFILGDQVQIGAAASDFNGAVINIFVDPTGTITANPGNISIISTNCYVNLIGDGNNAHYTHAMNWYVAQGSTFVTTSTSFNYNTELLTLMGAGTINFSNVIGNNDSTSAGGVIMNMTNGTLLLNQNTLGTFGNGTGGTGFTLTNGTMDFVSPQSLADVFGDFQSAGNNTVKFYGGAFDNLTGAAGTINVNNGSYVFGGNFAYLGSSQGLSLGSANVALAATSQIAVSNNTLTVGGVINDNGGGFGITKTGAGILALTGANSYSGPTVVTAGELIVNTASGGNGAFTNGDGATLGLKVLRVGQSLSMNGLTVGTSAGNSTLSFDVGILGNPTVAPINLGSGNLTVNGTANPISFTSISFITNYPAVIPLISYGTTSGNVSSFTMGSFPAASTNYQGYISNDTVNLVIDLVLTNGTASAPPPPSQQVVWNGQTNGIIAGNWDTNVVTTNWTFGGVPTNYVNLTASGSGDQVLFDDTLTGTTNVNLITTVVPASVTFNNSRSNYVFSGSGNISGSGSLTLTGTARVTIDNSGINNFNGGLTINSGTLQIGNNDANGSLGSGTVTDDGALVFDRSDAQLNVGVISGTGSITNIGSGTVTMNGIQSYSGMTVQNAGTLVISAPNVTVSGLASSSGLIINGGSVQAFSDNAIDGSTATLPITVNAGGTLTGLGTADGGAGTSSHITGMLTLNGGTLTMAGTENNTSHGTWDLDGGVTVPGGPAISTITALDVIPSQAGGTAFYITNGTTTNGIDLDITGTLIGGTSTHDNGFLKYGPGVMLLDNNNPFSNNVTIYGGTVQLGQTNDSSALPQPIGQGTVTINNSSILKLRSAKGVLVTNIIADDSTGIVFSSAGTNLLGGANTYSGQTIVGAGTFLILTNAGSINSSASVTVSNAVLNITSAFNPLSSSGSLTLTNGTFITGTNTAGYTTLTAGLSTFGLVVPQSTATPDVTAGTLTLTGNTNVINIIAVPGEPFFPTNIPIIKYTAFSNTNAANVLTNLGLILPSAGSPTAHLTNDIANSSIDLVIVTDTLTPIYPITWSGSSNSVSVGNWDILITPDWVLTSDGVTPYKYQDTSLLTFDDSAAGSTSIVLQTNVAPGSITFNNNSKNYSFSGAFKISTSLPLIKNNNASVTLAETGGDNFAAGVQMNNGTLVMADTNATIASGITVGNGALTLLQTNVTINGGITVNGGAFTAAYTGTENGNLTIGGGAALLDQAGTITGNLNITGGSLQVGTNDAKGVLPTGPIANAGTLIFDRSDAALSVGQVISGSGTVENNGTGTVTLTVTETMTGPVIANGGTLVLDAGNAVAPDGISRASGLTINTNATVAVLIDNSLAGQNATQGTLPITINAGGVLTGAAGADSGAGTSTHLPGTVTFNGGTLANSGTSLNAANGSWDLNGGVATGGQPFTSYITALDVALTETTATSFSIVPGGTPSGIDLEVLGTIIHTTSQADTGVALTGGGTLDFDNNNTYTGPTTVSGSTLQLGLPSDTNTLATPAGAVASTLTISSSGILKLAGNKGVTVGNVIADDGSGIVLSSAGTNQLTGADTYTGQTVVTAGSLALVGGGTINSSATITVSNATFDISAATNVMTSSGNLILQSAAFKAGTNVVTALASLEATNSTLSLALNTNVPDITVGTLTTGGATNVINLTSIPALVFPAQVPLIKYTTADPNLINGQNVPATLGVSFQGSGYLTNDTANSSIDVVIIATVNTARTNIIASFTNNQLTLSWPADHVGWRLLSQTNSLTTGLSANWVTVAGSTTVSNETFTVNPANGTVFYRLVYP